MSLRSRRAAEAVNASGVLADYPEIDGVVAFAHGAGCGMADEGPGFDNLQRVLWGHAAHPNVGAALFVGLGCEVMQVARLKAQEGGPIRAHGGAGFARSLLAEGLVDRLVLLVHPVALGRGLPIFSDLAAPRRLALVGSRAFPRGSVAQVYRPA